MSETSGKMNPLIAAAAVAEIVFSAVGVSYKVKVIDGNNGSKREENTCAHKDFF